MNPDSRKWMEQYDDTSSDMVLRGVVVNRVSKAPETDNCPQQTKPDREDAVQKQIEAIGKAMGANPCTTTNDTLVEGSYSWSEGVSGSASNDYAQIGCEQVSLMACSLSNTAYTTQCSQSSVSSNTTQVIVATTSLKLIVEDSTVAGSITVDADSTVDVNTTKEVNVNLSAEVRTSSKQAVESILKNLQAAEKGFLASSNSQKSGTLQDTENFASTLQKVTKSVEDTFDQYVKNGVEIDVRFSDSLIGGDITIGSKLHTIVSSTLVSDVIMKSVLDNKNVQGVKAATESEQDSKSAGLDAIVDSIADVVKHLATELAGVAKAYSMGFILVLGIGVGVILLGGVGTFAISRMVTKKIRVMQLLSYLSILLGIVLCVSSVQNTEDPYSSFMPLLVSDLERPLSVKTLTLLTIEMKIKTQAKMIPEIQEKQPYFDNVEDMTKWMRWFGEWIRDSPTEPTEFINIKKKITETAGAKENIMLAFPSTTPGPTLALLIPGIVLVVVGVGFLVLARVQTGTLSVLRPDASQSLENADPESRTDPSGSVEGVNSDSGSVLSDENA